MSNYSGSIPFKVTASENEYAQYEATLLKQAAAAIASSAAFFCLDQNDTKICPAKFTGTQY
jgi:hypothetical protein